MKFEGASYGVVSFRGSVNDMEAFYETKGDKGLENMKKNFK